MKINLYRNTRYDPTFKIGPAKCYTASAMPLEFVGIPDQWSGGTVTAVTITVVNADGVPLTAPATKDGDTWRILFAASNFATYGRIDHGLKVEAAITRPDGAVYILTVGIGGVEIKQGDANAEAGEPMAAYVVKGSDVYLKSELINGVQHFVRQTMEYDPDIGWGANWGGDFILVAGDFVPYEQPATEGGEPNDDQ